jgi:hypothetical protein
MIPLPKPLCNHKRASQDHFEATGITIPAGKPVIEYTYEREPGSHKLFARDVCQPDLQSLDTSAWPVSTEEIVMSDISNPEHSFPYPASLGMIMEVAPELPNTWSDSNPTVSIYTLIFGTLGLMLAFLKDKWMFSLLFSPYRMQCK